jgi:Asp/Glu/hydantoin racemase
MSDDTISMAASGVAASPAAIGILMLDSRFERPPGDPGNAASWPFPVLHAVVRGASPDKVVRDGAPGLLPAFIAAGRELVARGAAGIATSCGFLSIFQRELAQALEVPVATSALMQVPWVQAMLGPGRRVGVITACAATLTREHLAAAGAPADTPVAGLEHGAELYRVLVAGEKDDIDRQAAQQDLLAAGHRLLADHPEVAAIVLECTNLPPYASALQAATGLPVYDVHSMICWLHAGLRPRSFPGASSSATAPPRQP